MKDIFLLIKERKAFYLWLLLITLMITIYGAIFNLTSNTQSMQDNINVNTVTAQQIEKMLGTGAENSIFTRGADLGWTMQGFATGSTFMGYVGLMFLFPFVLFVSYYGMDDRASKEFLETLPVKKVALEMYNYVALLGILLINTVVGAAISIVMLGTKNNEIVELAQRFPQLLGNVVPNDLVSLSISAFLQDLGVVVLYLIAAFTLQYFCVTLFKNPYAGIVAGALFWNCSTILLGIQGMLPSGVLWSLADKAKVWFSPVLYFEQSVWMNNTWVNPMNGGIECALILFIVVMIAVMVFYIKGRELSKGKLFYMNFLNIIFLAVLGISTYAFLLELVIDYSYYFFETSGITPIVISAFVVTIAAFLLYFKRNKAYAVAVTEQKESKNPIWKSGMKSYIITTLLLSAGVLLYRINDLRVLKGVLMYNPYISSDVNWILNYFDMYYQMSLIYVIGFGWVVFKLLQFWVERNKATREFYKTLPFTDKKRFYSKLVMDIGFVLIPLLLLAIVNTFNLLEIKQILADDAPVIETIRQQFVIVEMAMGVMMALIGFVYCIDAMAVSGTFKVINVIAYYIFFAVVGVTMMEMSYIYVPVLYDMIGVILGEITLWGTVGCLIIGILLLFAARNMFIKRDEAKEIYYFSFGKYLFATAMSITYFILLFSSAINILQYILAFGGTILIWGLIIHLCTPGNALSKKWKQKKEAKEKQSLAVKNND